MEYEKIYDFRDLMKEYKGGYCVLSRVKKNYFEGFEIDEDRFVRK